MSWLPRNRVVVPYDFSDEAWVGLAEASPFNDDLLLGAPFSLGLTETGELGLGLPIYSIYARQKLGAIMYAQFDVAKFVKAIHSSVPDAEMPRSRGRSRDLRPAPPSRSPSAPCRPRRPGAA